MYANVSLFDEFPMEIYEIIINQLCFSRYVENLAKLNKRFASLFTPICHRIRSKELENSVFLSIPFFPKKEKERTRDYDRETIPHGYVKHIYLGGIKIGQIAWHWNVALIFGDSKWTAECIVPNELRMEFMIQLLGGKSRGEPSNNPMLHEIMKIVKVNFASQEVIGWDNCNEDYINLAAIETEFWKVWAVVNRT